MDAKNLADLYDLPIVDWAEIEAGLGGELTQAPGTGGPDRHTCWLATINADGSPHVNGVGGFWHDGAWWFVTSEQTRKGRNLARDPRCTMSLAADDFDVVIEGDAELIKDPELVAMIATTAADGGWPARVDDSGTALTAEFSAPSAGPPPWAVYRLQPRAAHALVVHEPGGATRWEF